MNYQPLGNRVVLKRIEITEEEKKAGEIILAESAILFQRAKVIAVGRGEVASQTGEIIPMEVSVGDTVLILKEVPGVPLRVDGEEYLLLRDNAIECVIPE